MTSVFEIMKNHRGREFQKPDCYFPIYERYFKKFKNKPVNMLEIGVYKGGSLQVWKAYFGKKAKIFGLDINPECETYEEDQIKITIGDQEDKTFLSELADGLPKLDIILDDGGHTMAQQINTFQTLYPRLAYGGVYICEDCGTSYNAKYGGGYRDSGTFIEFMKDKIDLLNMSFLELMAENEIGKHTLGISFHLGMVVLEKQKMEKPTPLTGGGEEGLRRRPYP